MVTRNIELSEEQNRLLEEIAAEQRRSVSELIREGVAEVLRTEGRPSREELKLRAAALSGRFRSGLSNLAAEHDRHLEESFDH
jgi:Arc/MetJ-type ribon-helix-helix transcriptional regulator